jgi:WD40 repeat protein
LWDLTSHPLVTFDDGNGLSASSAVFSSDGQHVLAVYNQAKLVTMRLWDLTGQPLVTVDDTLTGGLSLRETIFSPTKQYLLLIFGDFFREEAVIQLRDKTGKLRATFKDMHRASFSPDGQYILTASTNGMARLWDLSGQPLVTFDDGRGYMILSASFSSDGQYILTASTDGIARLWDLSGQPLVTFDDGRGYIILSASFSPDGQRVVTSADDGGLRAWNLRGQLLFTLKGHNGAVLSASFSLDKKHILSISRNMLLQSENIVYLWNKSGKLLFRLKGHAGRVKEAISTMAIGILLLSLKTILHITGT